MNVKSAFQTNSQLPPTSTKLLRLNSLSKVALKQQPFMQHMRKVISLNHKPTHIRMDKEFDLNYETSPKRKKQLLVRARTRCSLSRTPERKLQFELKGCQSSRFTPDLIEFEGKGALATTKSIAQLILKSSALYRIEKENTACLRQQMSKHRRHTPSLNDDLFTSTEKLKAVQDFKSNFYSGKMMSALRRPRRAVGSARALRIT
jgi:hypothetical protein